MGCCPWGRTESDMTEAMQQQQQHVFKIFFRGFPDGAVVKNSPASAGDARDTGSILMSERSPGEGNSNLPQFSCLENSMDRGVRGVTVQGVPKSQTPLSS